jgi:polar amino acid transport system substrate-binding protein
MKRPGLLINRFRYQSEASAYERRGMFNSKIKVALVALVAVVAIAIPVINAQKSSGCGQIKEGVLTIGTDDPAYGPWFDNNDPANGKGYEAAVAYAVAEELGYSKDKV